MKEVIYKLTGLLKHSEEDIFSSGCTGDSNTWSIDCVFTDTDIDNLIKQVVEFIGMEEDETENILLNSCDEFSRLDFQVYETQRGRKANSTDFDKWRKGEFRLWLANYSGRIERHTVERELDLIELVKDKTIYTCG